MTKRAAPLIESFRVPTALTEPAEVELRFGSLADAMTWLDVATAIMLPGGLEVPIMWATVRADLARPIGRPAQSKLLGTALVTITGHVIRHDPAPPVDPFVSFT